MCAQAPPPSALESARESASFQIAERGPHHRTWQKIFTTTDARGRVVFQTNLAYVELATGLHYADPQTGQWRESRELIEPVAGGAVARQGQHQVEFAANLASEGAIVLRLPDGRRVRSHLLGLAWWDAASGKGVLVGGVKECVGKLLPPNQVLYPDAFEGLKADVRYTWTLAGLEQDVILRESPPGPERFGLDPQTARLQVWTEFVEAPEARVEETAVTTKDGREAHDVLVDWGSMAIGPGRAFALGDATGQENKVTDAEGTGAVRVSKQWVKIEGRQFLVEEVEWGAVRAAVERLPAAQAARPEHERVGTVTMWLPAVPPKRLAAREAVPMQVAQAKQFEPGFVVDYVVLNTTQNNYTFRGDTTYFISAQVNFNGTTTFEGGAVIKFRRSNAGLRLNGPWVCRSGPYRPVIFTAQDDNTVGETIAGSTGNPTGYYGSGITLTRPGSFAHARFAHLTWAVRYEPRNDPELRLAHLQWVRCQAALSVVDDVCMCGTTIYVDNALVSQCPSFLTLLEGEEALVHARHLTVDQCGRLAECETGQLSLAMTNSILSSVTVVSSGGASVTGSHNAFYETDPFGEPAFGLGAFPFESVGAGQYYIAAWAAEQLRNAGTPNLPCALLDALAQKTSYGPTVMESSTVSADTCWTAHVLRDADAPDLGYHYDALDYLVRNVTVSGATLRLAPGCAVAVYGTPGFDLLSGARWESTGTPVKLNRLVRYQAVQEQPVILGNNPGNMMTLLRVPGSLPPLPQMEFRFTEVALLADSARRRTLFDNGGIHQADRLTFTDCRLYGVNLSVGTYRLLGDYRLMSLALTNCLTERCDIVASEESEDPELPSLVVHLRNNLFRNGTLAVADYLETGAWSVRDNLFDTVALTGLGLANSHNGYISTTVLAGSEGGDKTIAPPADYQEGPLGPYYYPTSGTKLAQLIDAGSRSARAAGLCRYTTLPSQIQEADTQVDIGLHYAPMERVAAVSKGSIAASASSEQEGHPPANVLDNSMYDPGWVGTESSMQWGWLRLDLGSSQPVRRLDYQPPEWDSQFETARQYEVYVTDSDSDDPLNWAVPVALGTWHWPTHLPNGPDTKTVEFTGSGRYVIMRLQSAWYPPAANELWVYGAHPQGTTLVPADTDQDNLPDYLEGCCTSLDVTPALGLTVTIEDSLECGGSNPNRQDRTVLTNLCVPEGMMVTLAVTVEGAVETHDPTFDRVYLNDVLLFQSTQEGTDCTMEIKTATANVILTPCNPTIRLRYDTGDEKWHQGAYARITAIQIIGSEPFSGRCVREGGTCN